MTAKTINMLCAFTVLLCIREQHETIFTAILLETATVSSLIHAVRITQFYSVLFSLKQLTKRNHKMEMRW